MTAAGELPAIAVRPAVAADVPAIHALLTLYARQGIVLERSEADLHVYLKNFLVAHLDGALVGCVAIRDFGNALLEVRSLAVLPTCKGSGVGRELINFARRRLDSERGHYRLFALTLAPGFFEKLGFKRVTREHFPEKIWHDCAQCPKCDRCDEIAVIYLPDDRS